MPFPWRLHQTQNPKSVAEPKPNKKSFFHELANHITALLSHPTAALKTEFESAVENLGNQARRALPLGLSKLPPPPNKIPFFARISPAAVVGARGRAMPSEAVKERLSGVPVYALSNAAEEFVLVSGMRTGRSLGLFCLKREDAEALLDQMRSMDHEMRQGSKVVAFPLNKIFQLNVDGVAFRLIPDPEQVLNAAKLKEKAGMAVDLPGVPVFQSRSLVLKSQGKSYRPAFFRKEDLEESLHKASHVQRQLNPSFRKGDIEVSVLEEIISAMQGSSTSEWDDIVFIPPGFNVAIAVREDKRPLSSEEFRIKKRVVE